VLWENRDKGKLAGTFNENRLGSRRVVPVVLARLLRHWVGSPNTAQGRGIDRNARQSPRLFRSGPLFA
jgi:hypothetical protein